MSNDASIIELGPWLSSPPGQYTTLWVQGRLDQEVANAFGFHALQLGLPAIEGLRANRMPHRWVASDAWLQNQDWPRLSQLLSSATREPATSGFGYSLREQDGATEGISTQPLEEAVHLYCEFDALPFPDASLDLLVLPHTLEFARDPHQTLREVERVLVPEGRVVIAGFNPASLWGLRQGLRQRLGHIDPAFAPHAREFIGYWRLRDWLRLLSFEVQAGHFGCWRPPVRSQAWLERWSWMDKIGDRWWPVLGAVYVVTAVKRVRGLRLVGLAKSERRAKGVATPLAVPQKVRRRGGQ